MTTTEAKMVVSHLIRPICTFLNNEDRFLWSFEKSCPVQGEMIARLETKRQSDVCDNCDLGILNAHWICTACGRTLCMECKSIQHDICTKTKGEHNLQVAVIQSSADSKFFSFLLCPA